MEHIYQFLIDRPHYAIVIWLTFVVIILWRGKEIVNFFKTLKGGQEVNVTINEDKGKDKKSGLPIVDPDLCRICQAEHERSTRNEDNIKNLWEAFNKLTAQIYTEISGLRKDQADGIAILHKNQLKLLLGLVQSGVLDTKYVPDDIGIAKPTRKEG